MNRGCPCRYQRECVELSQWLQSALERLEFWNTQAVLVPQELETVRDHLSAFLVRALIIYFSFIFFFFFFHLYIYRERDGDLGCSPVEFNLKERFSDSDLSSLNNAMSI